MHQNSRQNDRHKGTAPSARAQATVSIISKCSLAASTTAPHCTGSELLRRADATERCRAALERAAKCMHRLERKSEAAKRRGGVAEIKIYTTWSFAINTEKVSTISMSNLHHHRLFPHSPSSRFRRVELHSFSRNVSPFLFASPRRPSPSPFRDCDWVARIECNGGQRERETRIISEIATERTTSETEIPRNRLHSFASRFRKRSANAIIRRYHCCGATIIAEVT